MKAKTPIFSIVGKSDSGKTTFIEKLIPELKKFNLTVGTVKHHVHSFEVDIPGKDSWRHSQAGADLVMISSPDKFALYGKVDHELSLDEIAEKYLNEVDLIITEGYKSGNKKKLEIFREEVSRKPLCLEEEMIAIITDDQVEMDIPKFSLDDILGVAKFLLDQIKKYNNS